jgi:glycosyltransferase involved in cell wall biosynthesis
MRILLVGDYPPDARLGSTKVLVKLREEFCALGHSADLLLADDLGAFPRNPYLRQALGPVRALSAVRRMSSVRGPYDVIDVASAEGLWIGALRRLVGGAAVVSRSNGLEHLNYRRMIDDHHDGLRQKPWTRRLFHPAVRLTQVAAAARVADRLLLLNDLDLDFALRRRWKRAEDIDLVPHGMSSKFLANAPPIDASRGRGILFCGTWTEVKGVTYLAEAFCRMVDAGSEARLTILGGNVPASQIQADFRASVQPRVTILDRVAEDEVMKAYRTHDVLAMPSTYEGFGMVVVEAMSQRLPVVATPVGCARALVESGKTGLVVPPRDPAALAGALARMLADADLRRRCAAAAFERVRDMTWTNTARRTLDVYERARAGRANGH